MESSQIQKRALVVFGFWQKHMFMEYTRVILRAWYEHREFLKMPDLVSSSDEEVPGLISDSEDDDWMSQID